MPSVAKNKTLYVHDVLIVPKKGKKESDYQVILFTYKKEKVFEFSESVEDSYQIAKKNKMLIGQSKGNISSNTALRALTCHHLDKERVFALKEEDCHFLAGKFGGNIRSLHTDMRLSATFAQNIYLLAKEKGFIICEHTVKSI